MPPFLPSIITFRVVWYNKYIKFDNKNFYKRKIARKSLNIVGHLFRKDVKIMSRKDLKVYFSLDKKK